MIEKIAIIGAGQMGSGIAHVCALAGLDVTLIDVAQEQLDKARDNIERNLARQVSRGKIADIDKSEAISRIAQALNLEAISGVDLVIEAATENEAVKRDILMALCPVLDNPDALIATNTSSISVTRLAAVTDRPGKFMGMHFMNPVPVMKLVEVIRGLRTDDATTNAVMELSRTLGKTPVEVRDFPGFVSNRILAPMINEAVFALMEGVAEAEAIDTVMKLGMNHPMGPLTLADLIGLDVVLHILEVLHRELGDDRYRPCPLLVKYVEAGWIGRKAGRGFYDYSGDVPLPTR